MGKTKIDWQPIREAYIQASSEKERPTYQELSTQYNISLSSIQKKANAENWAKQAKEYVREKSLISAQANSDKFKKGVDAVTMHLLNAVINVLKDLDSTNLENSIQLLRCSQIVANCVKIRSYDIEELKQAIETFNKFGILSESQKLEILSARDKADEELIKAAEKAFNTNLENTDFEPVLILPQKEFAQVQ
ncbi:MAG: hypothetical protein F6J93_25705 [Oscillatoria sp. SIO1A7]|nr:hypothetical protein [Oscillatoria sp. SIO1A7]